MPDSRATLFLLAFICTGCSREPDNPIDALTLATDPSYATYTFDSDNTPGPEDPTTSGETSSTGPDTSAGTTAGTTGGGVDRLTVYDIQQGMVPEETFVQLTEVVVTSPMFFVLNGGAAYFFVAEQAGGEYSGIQVFTYSDVVDELDSEDKLPNVGDVLELEAIYRELDGSSELSLQYAEDLIITGAGMVPTPSVVAAADVATQGAQAENYEGCLVQIDGATVTTSLNEYGQFLVDDALLVDGVFFAPEPPMGTQFTALVGPLAYRFQESTLLPRSCADLQGWAACQD